MANNYNNYSDFEMFNKVAKKTNEPFITISKVGTATLNSGFLDKNHEKISGKTHVKLGYSKASNVIAIEFTDDHKDQASLKLTRSNKSNLTFSIRSFFNNYGLDLDKKAGRYSINFESIPRWGNYFIIKIAS